MMELKEPIDCKRGKYQPIVMRRASNQILFGLSNVMPGANGRNLAKEPDSKESIAAIPDELATAVSLPS